MTEQTSAVRPAAAGPAGGAAAKLPPVTAIVPCYNAAATLERAAAIRDELTAMGVVMKDTANGVEWSVTGPDNSRTAL